MLKWFAAHHKSYGVMEQLLQEILCNKPLKSAIKIGGKLVISCNERFPQTNISTDILICNTYIFIISEIAFPDLTIEKKVGTRES